jgi:hypothetical protein
MIRTVLVLCVAIAFSTSVAAQTPKTASVAPPIKQAESQADLTAHGFSGTKEIRYDESMGNKLPTPRIPKGWRLVSVGNGSGPNASNLWFVDNSGTVYMLQGFTARDGEFVIKPNVQTLRQE